ncbi:hypothetical protein DERP_001504 [Dermatophagoides pteronyssinus]|uniref:Reverse transcriptase domain-containing protein n=1 Tax=Dermatophagoides pteronyssinus TaxID=6956 RepID=A0ABQ8JF50_DERPT|nr:hypothetical protein DERP_001504 [Dermatophagoides pteronyssinus]
MNPISSSSSSFLNETNIGHVLKLLNENENKNEYNFLAHVEDLVLLSDMTKSEMEKLEINKLKPSLTCEFSGLIFRFVLFAWFRSSSR